MSIRYTRVTDLAFSREMEQKWSPVVARHLHFEDGYTLAAFDGREAIGVIAVTWRQLPEPLPPTTEAFIDIIEVRPAYRRQGIARSLLELAINEARLHGAYQIRAWSSDNKIEAIPMWRNLGFALCPAVIHARGEEVRGYYVAKTL